MQRYVMFKAQQLADNEKHSTFIHPFLACTTRSAQRQM